MNGLALQAILKHFPSAAVRDVQPLANAGGFSGSRLWKVAGASGEYCLRRWPTGHPTRERLAFIHAFQRHLSGCGFPFIPVPAATSAGCTFLEQEGHLWELVTWMPGRADYRERPSAARLAKAMKALATIHLAAATMPRQFRVGPSPGLAARLEQLRALLTGGIGQIEQAIAGRPLAWDDVAVQVCRQFRSLAPQVEPQLAQAAKIAGPLFPCLRDIWHDHVLYCGEEVSGVIDFGASRVENPAGDIARLVGSLVGDDRDGWREALAAYQAAGRAIDDADRQLIGIFDASGVLLAGINWLTWLYLDQRQFENPAGVTRRLEEIVARLNRIRIC